MSSLKRPRLLRHFSTASNSSRASATRPISAILWTNHKVAVTEHLTGVSGRTAMEIALASRFWIGSCIATKEPWRSRFSTRDRVLRNLGSVTARKPSSGRRRTSAHSSPRELDTNEFLLSSHAKSRMRAFMCCAALVQRFALSARPILAAIFPRRSQAAQHMTAENVCSESGAASMSSLTHGDWSGFSNMLSAISPSFSRRS
mmetsp:Transcript_5492/g.9517  ORF Transcript_5492/g.9517 Transcript_5492/m.9517 type:complete len:202 (+) Transcript_5492:175-780(+)